MCSVHLFLHEHDHFPCNEHFFPRFKCRLPSRQYKDISFVTSECLTIEGLFVTLVCKKASLISLSYNKCEGLRVITTSKYVGTMKTIMSLKGAFIKVSRIGRLYS